ncbi:AI-2E family transporter, partial [Turicibacter sanguinis]|nr:AI-2E family transporter [Turicibacter sanguinis]
MEKWLEKRISFIKGLFFVSCAYIIIKMVDNYQVFFASFKDILATLSPFLLAF